MIYKRCFAKINGKRTQVNTNKIVEDNLGSLGIICLDDIVNEISTFGEHFIDVVKFLW